MENFFAVITWVALTLGLIFVLWKAYLFITWNIERSVFMDSVSHYLKNNPKTGRKKSQAAAK